MNIKNVHYVFFSPTGTTQAAIRAVGNGTGRTAGQMLDITVGAPEGAIPFTKEDLVIVGMPVYSGRLPGLAVERFRAIGGKNTPVVPIVVYGNRAYDDALVELSDLCAAQGLHTVAAGAFIGEHSFSTVEFPIAVDRPDGEDLQYAEQFGSRITQLLDTCESVAQLALPELPGNRPYKSAMQPVPVATCTDPQACTQCGKCVACCPTQGIRMTDAGPVTEADSCIWCMACVRNCPTNARLVSLPKINDIAQRLHGACKERRKPESFLAS